MPTVNSNTVPFTPISSPRGKPPGTIASTGCTPQVASAIPSAPPTMESRQLSVSNCRSTRAQLAPSAARIANSRLRAAARASNRFATFAHAINKTSPTAPNNVRSIPLTSPTICSFSGVTLVPKSPYSRRGRVDPGRVGLCSSLPALQRGSRPNSGVRYRRCPRGCRDR